MFVRRNVIATAVVGALALGACGTSSDDTATQIPAAPSATDASAAPDTEALTPTPTDEAAPTVAPVVTQQPVDTAGEPEPTATDAPAATQAPTTTPPATTTPAATTPAATTPPPAEVGGRAFAEALSADSDVATNPLPDLLVDDIRRGAKVNLRNVFPADRPVLIWMWAPH